jgi:membrane protease YdiL (CAAX protease family)
MTKKLLGEDRSKEFQKNLPNLSLGRILFLGFILSIASSILALLILAPFNIESGEMGDLLADFAVQVVILILAFKFIFRSFNELLKLFTSLRILEVIKDFLIIGIPFYLVIFLVSTLNFIIDQKRLLEVQNLLFNQTFEPLFGNFVIDFIAFNIIYVLVAISEEVLFRGGIYRGLRKKISKKLAIIISALIFYIPHWEFSILGVISVFGIAVINAWYLEYKNNLMVPMLIHYFHNAFSIGLTTFGSMYFANYILRAYR